MPVRKGRPAGANVYLCPVKNNSMRAKIAWLTLWLFLCLPVWTSAQFSAARRTYVEYVCSPDHPDFLYKTGEKATFRIDALAGGLPLDGVTVHYTCGPDMLAADRQDSAVFRKGRAELHAGTMKEPGFRFCSYSFTVGGKTYSDKLKVGFSAGKIASCTPVPDDFAAFWQQAVEEAGRVPLNPVVTPLPDRSTDKVDVSLVCLTVGKNGRTMYGYLTAPKDGERHPVLFCPPGAGNNKISMSAYYAERGYIYLNVNIHDGLNPELPDREYNMLKRQTDNYTYDGIDQPETFYYRDVYAGCARCVDYLCSLPAWDGRNVGVTGGSQGGALTVITAALNPKVTFCSAFYPALCDVLGFLSGRAGGWPKYFEKEAGSTAHEAERKTLAYYDVVNFGRMLRCPVFLSFGYADDTCCPTSVYALRNVITAPLKVAVTPYSGHWRYGETNEDAMLWQQQQFK